MGKVTGVQAKIALKELEATCSGLMFVHYDGGRQQEVVNPLLACLARLNDYIDQHESQTMLDEVDQAIAAMPDAETE